MNTDFNLFQEKGKKKKHFVVSKYVLQVIISEEERKKEHEELVSKLHATYVCYDCGVGFATHEAYKSHEKKHSPASGDAKCDVCGIYRSSSKMLYYHRNQHYRRFRCTICNAMFRDRDRARQHVISDHAEETRCDYGKVRKSIKRSAKRKRQKIEQYFACPHCEGFYKSEAYMQLHVRTVHKIAGKWLACNCGRVFPNRSRLNDHKANVHGDAYKDNVCARCGKAFKTKSLLNRHQSVHSTETFPCPECDASFRSREYVRIHYKMKHLNMTRAEIKAQTKKYRPLWIHDVKTKGKILFENDDKGETVESKVEDKLNVSESSESRKCICDHCGKEYPTKTILKRHMYAHMGLIFPCNVCDAEFKSPCNLKKHYRRTHKLARGEVKQCTENDGFLWGQDSNDVVQINTEENGQDSVGTSEAIQTMFEDRIDAAKKFACDDCGKRYQTKTLLRRHQLSHTGQTYPCTECAAIFRAPDYLRKHYKRHLLNMTQNHFISGPMLMADLVAPASKIYTCNDCGKEFKGKSTLKRHLQLVHTDITFPCNECGQRFKTREYVKVHYKIKHLNMSRAEIKAQSKRGDSAVSDEPPPRKHICSYCDKAYPTNALLKRHTHVHMNESYPCNVCERTFQTLEYLRHHLKTKKHLKMIGADIQTEFKKRKPKKSRKIKQVAVVVEKDPLACDDEFDDDDDDLNLVDIVAAHTNAV